MSDKIDELFDSSKAKVVLDFDEHQELLKKARSKFHKVTVYFGLTSEAEKAITSLSLPERFHPLFMEGCQYWNEHTINLHGYVAFDTDGESKDIHCTNYDDFDGIARRLSASIKERYVAEVRQLTQPVSDLESRIHHLENTLHDVNITRNKERRWHTRMQWFLGVLVIASGVFGYYFGMVN